MEKKVKQISKCVLEKLDDGCSMDWISELPDEILASIISRLTLREALSTSALSKRWRDIWKFTTGSLDFDAPMAKWRWFADLEASQSKYARWVNQVLELHRGSTIDVFRVCFCSDARYKCLIDRWIDFAIAKKAQFLELHLATFHNLSFKSPELLYSFSEERFTHAENPNSLSSIKSLRSISLKFVNVRGEILEFLLCNCPLLERLSVEWSAHLVSLKVVGSSLPLKYLAITSCSNLRNLVISAPRLKSFNYFGQSCFKMHVESAPLLVDVSIDVKRGSDALDGVASYFSQLEMLKLEFWMYKFGVPLPDCELTRLRHLTMTVYADDSANLLGLSSFIKVCPFLQRFTLQLKFQGGPRRRKKIRTVRKCPHQHLKIVELNGFIGRPTDLELAIYLLDNAVMLEKMIIMTAKHYPYLARRARKFPENASEQAARLLETKVPRGAELIIL